MKITRCIDRYRDFMKYDNFRYHFESDMRTKGKYHKGWYPQRLWLLYMLKE